VESKVVGQFRMKNRSEDARRFGGSDIVVYL
jgi:hypothetical protein